MAILTKKRSTDDLIEILTRLGETDDSRLDPDYIGEKIDQCRSQMIIASYEKDGVVDMTWLSDLSVTSFSEVNFADDINISYCNCDISKAFIPNVVSLRGRGDGNVDLGLFSIMSTCGKTEYYPFPMSTWRILPKEHVRSKFHYYSRINTALYVNKIVDSLLIRAVLESPEDGYIINSIAVNSGEIETGIVYKVKYKQVVYNGVTYVANSTFTGVISVTTFAGQGKVYLNSQLQALSETEPYPCSRDMMRQIILDICVKEFRIEASQIPDLINDNTDDATKSNQ